jgi:hypothetical protein
MRTERRKASRILPKTANSGTEGYWRLRRSMAESKWNMRIIKRDKKSEPELGQGKTKMMTRYSCIIVSVDPTQDDDGQRYETPNKTITLDKVERKAFAHDYGFYNAETGKMESRDTLLSRDDIWDWSLASLRGGPLFYLVKQCPVEGDVQWLYQTIKEMAHTPSILSHAKLVGKFFSTQCDGTNLSECRLQLDEDTDEAERVSAEVDCGEFKLPVLLRRALLTYIALQFDPHLHRMRAIERLIDKNPEYSMDDLLTAVRQDELQRNELAGVPKQALKSQGLVNATYRVGPQDSDTIGQTGLCYGFLTKEGCRYGDKWRFEHRARTLEEQQPAKGRGKGSTSITRYPRICPVCGKTDCPCKFEGICTLCNKQGRLFF